MFYFFNRTLLLWVYWRCIFSFFRVIGQVVKFKLTFFLTFVIKFFLHWNFHYFLVMLTACYTWYRLTIIISSFFLWYFLVIGLFFINLLLMRYLENPSVTTHRKLIMWSRVVRYHIWNGGPSFGVIILALFFLHYNVVCITEILLRNIQIINYLGITLIVAFIWWISRFTWVFIVEVGLFLL